MEDTRPWIYVENLTKIAPGFLRKNGIRFLILDWDQTLWNRAGYLSIQNIVAIKQWLGSGVIEGFVVLSNSVFANKRKKADGIKLHLKNAGLSPVAIICLGRKERKPQAAGFRRAQEALGCDAKNALVIGDQLVSDIAGGNRAGFKTALVDSVGECGLSTKVSGRARRNQQEMRRLELAPTICEG